MGEPFHTLSALQQSALMAQCAIQALGQHWGLRDCVPQLIKYRENAVFRVDLGGVRTAVRVHRYDYHSDAALTSELQWMAALDAAGICVPTVVPTREGALFAVVDVPGMPGPMQVDRFAWIDGEQLGSVEDGVTDPAAAADTYRTIGQLAARVHNQASGWTLPAGFVRHTWDADGLAGPNPLWGRFWELEAASETQRALMRRCRDHIHRELSSRGRHQGQYSMIHADFVPENLMVTGSGVRLIDFDDAGFGWHLFELATALYFIQAEPYFDTARAALIAGYREHRPLSEQMLADLPLHLLARAFTYIGWVHTRPGTETAEELTPMLLEMAMSQAESFMSNTGSKPAPA